jgi:hypothetical protein
VSLGVGGVLETRHRAIGIQRERERHRRVFYRTRQIREGHADSIAANSRARRLLQLSPLLRARQGRSTPRCTP